MYTEYKEFSIIFLEATEEWECSQVGARNKSLATVKEKIDAHIRKERAFTRFKVIRCGEAWRGHFGEEGEVTSITEDGKEIWVTCDGRRSKEQINNTPFCRDTPDNRKRVEEILGLIAGIKTIQEKIEAIRASFPPLFESASKEAGDGDV